MAGCYGIMAARTRDGASYTSDLVRSFYGESDTDAIQEFDRYRRKNFRTNWPCFLYRARDGQIIASRYTKSAIKKREERRRRRELVVLAEGWYGSLQVQPVQVWRVVRRESPCIGAYTANWPSKDLRRMPTIRVMIGRGRRAYAVPWCHEVYVHKRVSADTLAHEFLHCRVGRLGTRWHSTEFNNYDRLIYEALRREKWWPKKDEHVSVAALPKQSAS